MQGYTALGAPGMGMPEANAAPMSPLPPREGETTAERIARIDRELARSEGRVYLGDQMRHPVTGTVVVKPCGTPQPDPSKYVVEAKAKFKVAQQESIAMLISGRGSSMSEKAQNLARLGFPAGDDTFEKPSEQQAAFTGRGYSPGRQKRLDQAGGQSKENDRQIHLEWARIQAVQPKMRLKADEVEKYERYKGTRFYKEVAFDEVSAAEQKKELMAQKAAKKLEVLG